MPDQLSDKMLSAAKNMDWQQVVLNGGPPCFHLEGGSFCGRARRWAGHDDLHKYVPLDDLIQHLLTRAQNAETKCAEAGFSKAFAEIRRLITVNAKHRDEWRMAEAHPNAIIHHAKTEFKEMMDCVSGSVAEQKELADVLGCLFHLILKRGWTPEEIQTVMLAKFKERFTEYARTALETK